MNNRKAILLSLVLFIIVTGTVIVVYRNNIMTLFTFKSTINAVPQLDRSEDSDRPATISLYMPTPIDRSRLLSGTFTENRSLDGKFISHTFDNEQGDSGVYLTTSDGTEVSATYCGYFKEWSPDSKKITVFVPFTCGKEVTENETFELHIDGTISK
jgi:hypothetical protein